MDYANKRLPSAPEKPNKLLIFLNAVMKRILFTLIAAILLPLGLFAQEAVEKAEKGIDEIINEADVFLTGDISHRYFLLADDNNLGLVQVNHISTEIPGMSKFVDILANELNIKVKYFYNKNYG